MFFEFVPPGRREGASALKSAATLPLLGKAQALDFVRERRELFDVAGRENPFAGSAWMLHFIEQVARDDWKFLIPVCRGDGESLLMLCADGQSGRRFEAVANCYTSLYSPFISSAVNRGAGLRVLADRLTVRRSGCAAIRLAPLDEESPDTAALEQAFAERGWYVKRFFSFGNWYLPCKGLSFEEYMAGRNSRLRNTWQRKSKKFHGSGSANARLEIVTAPRDVEAAMDAYDRVYRKSWKEPEAYPTFVRDWARVCARNGWLRLGLAWIGEVPVAAQFWFTLHGRANIFKLAYDEEYARWSAGTVLTAHMFRYALDQDRVAEIDYLTGDDPYKQSWMTRRRERIGLLACNPMTPRGLLLAAGDYAREKLRPWRRLLRPAANPGVALPS